MLLLLFSCTPMREAQKPNSILIGVELNPINWRATFLMNNGETLTRGWKRGKPPCNYIIGTPFYTH